jgi:hypothetical protein
MAKRTRRGVLARLGRWMIAIRWEPRDLWVGMYWERGAYYVCLIPTLPIVISRAA